MGSDRKTGKATQRRIANEMNVGCEEPKLELFKITLEQETRNR